MLISDGERFGNFLLNAVRKPARIKALARRLGYILFPGGIFASNSICLWSMGLSPSTILEISSDERVRFSVIITFEYTKTLTSNLPACKSLQLARRFVHDTPGTGVLPHPSPLPQGEGKGAVFIPSNLRFSILGFAGIHLCCL